MPIISLVSCDVASRMRRSVNQAPDSKRNEEFRKVYDQQLELERQRATQMAEHLAIEKERWQKYADETERDEERWKEGDLRDERYEAVLTKWEEQAKRFDAILDRWEKIEPPQQSSSH